jgi:hypothetical protein
MKTFIDFLEIDAAEVERRLLSFIKEEDIPMINKNTVAFEYWRRSKTKEWNKEQPCVRSMLKEAFMAGINHRKKEEFDKEFGVSTEKNNNPFHKEIEKVKKAFDGIAKGFGSGGLVKGSCKPGGVIIVPKGLEFQFLDKKIDNDKPKMPVVIFEPIKEKGKLVGMFMAFEVDAEKGEIGTGYSVCHPIDTFNWKTGVDLCFDRMFDVGDNAPEKIIKKWIAFNDRVRKIHGVHPSVLEGSSRGSREKLIKEKFLENLPKWMKPNVERDAEKLAKKKEAMKEVRYFLNVNVARQSFFGLYEVPSQEITFSNEIDPLNMCMHDRYFKVTIELVDRNAK